MLADRPPASLAPVPPPRPAVPAAHLDALRQGLVLTGPDGRALLVTQRARELLDLPPSAEIEGRPLRILARVLAEGCSDGLPDGEAGIRDGLAARLEAAGPAAQTFEVERRGRILQIEVVPVPEGGWSAAVEDVTQRRAAEAGAAEAARLDPLTGLPNRLLLHERLGAALAQTARTGQGCAVILIDLDRFKPVNDTLGHPVGDALLQKVSDRLRSAVRATDTVARIGGDEFVVLQTGVAAAAEVRALASRLVDLIGRTYMVEGHLLTIGASLGIALAPGDGTSAEALLRNADLALYRSKLVGRGTFHFFEPEMDARMQARRRLELDMRQALARREFQLHYQPQLSLETDSITGCEALLRWSHPERGMVSPLDFIPLAEEIGLIVPIGEWVIRQACRDAAAWPVPLSIAVNVSPAQFKSERLVETILSALASAGLPASRLEVEITEGVLLQDNARTLQILHRLRTLGVRVSMDDFGTGYSSLSYLRSFPFDKIKIDRSFVKDLAAKPDGDAIIRAIAGLGKSLGMTTVAEGVETHDQMQRIRAEGCTDVQGYLISKPVPSDEVVRILGRGWRAGKP